MLGCDLVKQGEGEHKPYRLTTTFSVILLSRVKPIGTDDHVQSDVVMQGKDGQLGTDLACRKLMQGAGFRVGQGLHRGIGFGRAE